MGVFDINGKFFKTLTKAGDFIILTLLAMVCSIPVITIGASLTAVFYAALKMARDEEGYVWKEFFKSFKQNLKQSILIELILAAFAAILLVDINVCAKWAADGGGTLVQLLMFAAIGILIVLAAVVLVEKTVVFQTVLYVFPVLAKFDNTVFATIKNALVLCMHHLPQTISMMIATYGLIYFTMQYVGIMFISIPLIFYIDSFIFSRILQQYVKKDEADTDEL